MEEKGVGSEAQRLGVKESPIPKTKDRQLAEFSYSVTKIRLETPPSFNGDGHTGGGGCDCGYVNTGGCVVAGRPGIWGPGNVGRA